MRKKLKKNVRFRLKGVRDGGSEVPERYIVTPAGSFRRKSEQHYNLKKFTRKRADYPWQAVSVREAGAGSAGSDA